MKKKRKKKSEVLCINVFCPFYLWRGPESRTHVTKGANGFDLYLHSTFFLMSKILLKVRSPHKTNRYRC